MKKNEDKEKDLLIKSLVDITIESYRIVKIFEHILHKLDSREQVRVQGQLSWFNKKIDEIISNTKLEIINLEGQRYDVGMAATPLNIEEFDQNEDLLVQQMIEPIIMSEGSIIKTGTMILGRTQT